MTALLASPASAVPPASGTADKPRRAEAAEEVECTSRKHDCTDQRRHRDCRHRWRPPIDNAWSLRKKPTGLRKKRNCRATADLAQALRQCRNRGVEHRRAAPFVELRNDDQIGRASCR